MPWRPIDAAWAPPIRGAHGAKFRGEHDLVSSPANRLPDQCLVLPETVDIGCIQKIDA